MLIWQDLFLSIFDGVIIAGVLVFVGYLLNRRLERDKANEDIRKQIAADRVAAYLTLWQLTSEISVLSEKELTVSKAKKLQQKFTEWYYNGGNAIYLSHKATSLFLAARSSLQVSCPDLETVRQAFSQLRTQMKQDIGVYSQKEAQTLV